MPTRPPIPIVLIFEKFAPLEDPRIDRTRHHPLVNVVIMALCGVVCGCDGWEALEAFAQSRAGWFGTFLDLTHGTPSADTFRRVFEALDPAQFEKCFRAWVEALQRPLAGEVIACDGKGLKGAIRGANKVVPLQLMHVWATRQGLLLAQRAVEGAPGEVRALPEMLALLDIRGGIVTADANSCTAATTQAVRAGGAHYVLALKGNRGPLHSKVKELFAHAEARGWRGVKAARSTERGHGRRETRVARTLALSDGFAGPHWKDLRCAVRIDRTREVDGKVKPFTHYYISDLPPDPAQLARCVRQHWSVENGLHWSLDIAFDEDSRQIRDRNAAQNFALMARMALMLLRALPGRYGVPIRRKKAGWDANYLASVLLGAIAGV